MFSLLKSSKTHSKGKLRKHFKKPLPEETIGKVYQQFVDADCKKTERKYLLKVIEQCYNNIPNQIELTSILNLPFVPGPISLHAFPSVLLEQNQVIGHKQEGEQQTQLEFLFNYLKNVRQYYYCWIIYFNEDLKILNVKLLKHEEIHDHQDLLNPILNLIGIFVNKAAPNRLHRHLEEEYYGLERQVREREQGNQYNKSISTLNSSTGVTWKARTKMEKINQQAAQPYHLNEQKKKKVKRPSFLSKKNNQMSKTSQEAQKSMSKDHKSFSIKCLKQKSKSHILLNRSKSNNFKQIILEPIKNSEGIKNAVIAPIKAKALPQKSKLKKQSKANKADSFYFRKVQGLE